MTTPWIVCDRAHEARVLNMTDGRVALQIRVGGIPATTTLLGPQARLAIAEGLAASAPTQPSPGAGRSGGPAS